MKNYSKIFFFLIFIGIVLIIFKTWIIPGIITAGDLPYYYPTILQSTSFLSAWDIRNTGMGSSMLPTLWLELYTTLSFNLFGFLSWSLYERIAWFYPYLLFSLGSSYFLFKIYFKQSIYGLIAAFIYTCNTYALLLIGGGQMGVALSYGFSPFSLVSLEFFLESPSLFRTVLFTLSYSLVVLLDIRMAYMMLFVFFIRLLWNLKYIISSKKTVMYLILSGILTSLIHTFWLLPTLLTHGAAINQLGSIYTSSKSVQFFSFAKFENAFGLLQPNWPENIFGKVGFMKPEFLFLPILAYSSLFFLKKEDKHVLYLGLLGLVGAFLAKGANDPFGGVYIWMFNHIPGFIMFRDPTKWYLLIAISYAMLIPYSISKTHKSLQNIKKFSIFNFQFSINYKILNVQNIFILLVCGYQLFTIRQAIFGQLGGTFKAVTIPQEYFQLEQFLDNNQNFSRTLWIPTIQRFGYSSQIHPAVSGYSFFNSTDPKEVISKIESQKTQKLLQEAAIKYVIVPFDSQGEIFLSDRKYDALLYQRTVKQLGSVYWLHEISGFGKIKVFAVSYPKDHFWLSGKGNVTYKMTNPTTYQVNLSNVQKGEQLVFSESYDKYWEMQKKENGKQKSGSIQYNKLFNSFLLSESGSYSLVIFYAPQQWVIEGLWISGVMLSVLLLILLYNVIIRL